MGPASARAVRAATCGWLACALAASGGGASGLAAQDRDVDGRWDVRWAQSIRVDADGSIDVRRWGDAVLELTRTGGAVHGSWTTSASGVATRWEVSGSVEGDRLRLEATRSDSRDPALAAIERIEWEGRVDGPRVAGEMRLVITGVERPPAARPFTASRSAGSHLGSGGARPPEPTLVTPTH